MPRPNEQIGPYTLIRQLGRGGFGAACRCASRTKYATSVRSPYFGFRVVISAAS